MCRMGSDRIKFAWIGSDWRMAPPPRTDRTGRADTPRPFAQTTQRKCAPTGQSAAGSERAWDHWWSAESRSLTRQSRRMTLLAGADRAARQKISGNSCRLRRRTGMSLIEASGFSAGQWGLGDGDDARGWRGSCRPGTRCGLGVSDRPARWPLISDRGTGVFRP